ncbi:dihydroorotate dehydrogenase [Flavonifractor sp. DFI.6.63]|uniref:Dihydroorotate dehydrogenase n=1 Tax=Lawsonibacter hominis TaxID=2763053 RepID=A0A8J6MAS2_9FIRM|nr:MULTISPECIES: dihydroorotate dehydrogenase [Oscillospiraceae]MBC5735321.1 dihydroorotate dehydrogenase [Lawsonibacter hominis]MBS1385349.1 dihydroorotate dehydrogenase [Flavonifractor sp.]MCQ5031157.1 dihydroorotate dehydrogenase [Flavonifractor sp. DFI.6.63]MDU2196784.1 dihydroorotate dehydrogenase [Clostridiales bacterium]
MLSLETRLGRAVFRNPVFGASGCTGHGYELAGYTDLSRFGAVSLKTFTPAPRAGNPPERIAEVPAGVLNSIGLQNPGKDAFFAQTMPRVLAALERDQIVVSVGGDTIEDYVALCRETEARFGGRIAALELNAACPNVSHGAGFYSRDPQAARELVQAVREAVVLPVFLKFNTNFPNYLEVAAAVEAAGADALYTTNTPLGMKIDLHRRRPALGNGRGPICGPAIRPIGVLRTWELYEAVRLPIIASGGIRTWEDAVEYLLAGACAVGVGSAQFVQPDAASDILSGLERYAAAEGLECLTPLVGAAHP